MKYKLENYSEILGAPCPETFATFEDAESRKGELIEQLAIDLNLDIDNEEFNSLVIEAINE